MVGRALLYVFVIGLVLRAAAAEDTAAESDRPRPFPGSSAAVESRPYPLHQPLWQTDDLHAVVRQARDFVDRNPAAPEAPRVILDWMMAARLTRNVPVEQDAQRRLVFDYPASLQTAYVLSQFRQSSELVALLEKEFDEHLDDPSPESELRVARAIRQGVRQFQSNLFTSDAFALRCWLAAKTLGDESLAEAAMYTLDEKSREQQEINAIVLDVSADPVERIQKLLQPREGYVAIPFARYLLARLPAADRDRPDVQKARVTCMIQQWQWAKAVEAIQALPAAAIDAPTLYARGCAEYALGDAAAARGTLREVAARFEPTPWAASARELLVALESSEENLDQQAIIASAALVRMSDPANDRWQASVVWQPDSPQPIQAAVDHNIAGNTMELTVLRGTQRLFGYRSDGQTRTYLFPGEAFARRYPETGHLIPVIEVGLDTVDRRQNFAFNSQILTAPTLTQAVLNRRGLFSDAAILEAGGPARLLQALFGFTSIPCTPEKTATGTRLTWLRPEVVTPVVNRESLEFDSTGRLRQLRYARFELRGLRYGSNDSEPPMPSQLAGLEVRDEQKADPAAAMRALATLLEFFNETSKEAPEAVANQPEAAAAK